MRDSTQVKSMRFPKARSAEVLERFAEKDRQPFVVMQNGEAEAVLQDIASYERQQETLALLKVLALGTAQVEAGRTRPMQAAIDDLRRRRKSGE